MAHVTLHPPAHVCWVQEAGDTREAFSALKAQFISHHDLLEAKERELVRQDGKVTALPYSALGQVKEKKRKEKSMPLGVMMAAFVPRSSPRWEQCTCSVFWQ